MLENHTVVTTLQGVQVDENHQKKPQQWEHFASPGHVLHAQVETWRFRQKAAWLWLLAAVLVLIAGLFISVQAARLAGGSAGLLAEAVNWVGSVGGPSLPPENPAPAVNQILPVVDPGTSFDLESVPSLSEVVKPEIQKALATLEAGQKIEGCLEDRKITEDWAPSADVTPKCRYGSEDGKIVRAWIWSVVKTGPYQIQPFLTLAARQPDGKAFIFYDVNVPVAAGMDAGHPLTQDSIPRSVAADFPELVAK